MRNKKVLTAVFGTAVALVLLSLAVWNAVLTSKLNKAEKMYNEQVSANERLAAMIEGGTKPSEEAEISERGIKTGIPDEIYDKIFGTTLFDNSPVKKDSLVYLTVPYYNFSGETAIGHMIVNKKPPRMCLTFLRSFTKYNIRLRKWILRRNLTRCSQRF